MKMLLRSEGGRRPCGPARPPSPLAPQRFWGAANSFLLLLSNGFSWGSGAVPEVLQASIDLFTQLSRVGLFIQALQPLAVWLTKHPCGEEALIGRLSLVPLASHFVSLHLLLREMHHRLEQVVVHPHVLIERIGCRDLLRGIQAQMPQILAHQGVVFLLDETIVIFVIGATP